MGKMLVSVGLLVLVCVGIYVDAQYRHKSCQDQGFDRYARHIGCIKIGSPIIVGTNK